MSGSSHGSRGPPLRLCQAIDQAAIPSRPAINVAVRARWSGYDERRAIGIGMLWAVNTSAAARRRGSGRASKAAAIRAALASMNSG